MSHRISHHRLAAENVQPGDEWRAADDYFGCREAVSKDKVEIVSVTPTDFGEWTEIKTDDGAVHVIPSPHHIEVTRYMEL